MFPPLLVESSHNHNIDNMLVMLLYHSVFNIQYHDIALMNCIDWQMELRQYQHIIILAVIGVLLAAAAHYHHHQSCHHFIVDHVILHHIVNHLL
jgi:hypothetical protein